MECRARLFIERPSSSSSNSNNHSNHPPASSPPSVASAVPASPLSHQEYDWHSHVQPVYQRQPMSMRASPRAYHSQYSYSQSAGRGNKGVVQNMKRCRVALPKNYVLLEMMESSVRYQFKTNVAVEGGEDEDYDSDEDRAFVASGIELFNELGCGTYAVTIPSVAIVSASEHEKRKGVDCKDEEPQLIPLNEMIDKLDVTVSNDSVDIRSSPSMSDLIKPRKKNQNQSVLKYCDLIQVVSIKDGYAKISRKKGFVKVNKSNIVRVGGIRDEACRIEAMIELFQIKLPTFGEKQQYISSQLERLKAKLGEVGDFEFPEKPSAEELAKLKGGATHELETEANDLTPRYDYVQSSASFGSHIITSTVDENEVELDESSTHQQHFSPSILRSSTNLSLEQRNNHVAFSDDNETYETPTRNASESTSRWFELSPEASDQLSIPTLNLQRQYRDAEHDDPPSPFLCADLFGLLHTSGGAEMYPEIANQNRLFSEINADMNTAGDLSPRSRVNFRTGMSGHKGMLSNKAHKEGTPNTRSLSSRFLMSQHTGLSSKYRRSNRGDQSPVLHNTKTW